MIIASETNEDDKDFIVRILANTFLSKGFGYCHGVQAVREQLSKTIVPSTFNNYMTTIIKGAFLELEDFVFKNCNTQQLKPLTYKQIQTIRTPMTKCRQWMSQSQLNSFFKFIMISILQCPQDINKSDALDLYKRLHYFATHGSEKKKTLKEGKINRRVEQISKRIGLDSALKLQARSTKEVEMSCPSQGTSNSQELKEKKQNHQDTE